MSAVTHSLVAQYSALGAAHYLGRLRLSLLAAAVRRRTALLRLARTLVSRQARRRAASSTGSGLVGAGWIVQHLLRGRTRCHHTIAARNRVGVTFFGRGGIECRTRDLLEQIAVDRACCGPNQSGGSDNRGCVSWSTSHRIVARARSVPWRRLLAVESTPSCSSCCMTERARCCVVSSSSPTCAVDTVSQPSASISDTARAYSVEKLSAALGILAVSEYRPFACSTASPRATISRIAPAHDHVVHVGWLALGGSTSTLRRQRTTNLRCRKARSVASHLRNRDHLALLQHLPHELLEAWLRASIVLAMLLIRRCGSLGRQWTRLVGCLAHKECRRWLIQVRRGLDLQAVHMRISISNNITSGARRMARTSRRDRACTPRRP